LDLYDQHINTKHHQKLFNRQSTVGSEHLNSILCQGIKKKALEAIGTMAKRGGSLLILSTIFIGSSSFQSAVPWAIGSPAFVLKSTNTNTDTNEWTGEVVSNTPGGKIQGCTIQPSTPDSLTEWVLNIDGVEADLGRFSDAVYKKITGDAKRQRFQGFRPGTIPPHLTVTYMAFAMDECARECVLEALQQNNVRPFDSARSEMVLETFSVPPVTGPVKSKKKKSGRKQKASTTIDTSNVKDANELDDSPPQWRTFATKSKILPRRMVQLLWV
jgi:hypothetical protein